MLPNFVDFIVGLGGSGFWGVNPPTDPKVSGSVDGDPPPTVGLVGLGLCWSVLGGFDRLIRSLGPVDTPNSCKKIPHKMCSKHGSSGQNI